MNDILLVISCKNPANWYRNDIGKVFTIRENVDNSSDMCAIIRPNFRNGDVIYSVKLTDCIIGKQAVRKYRLENLLPEL